MELSLNVETRTRTGSAVKLVRADGFVPGVVYTQGHAATPVQFREIELERVIRGGGGSQLVELQGLSDQARHTLLREVQRHPTRRNIIHADFYEVQMDVLIRTEIPVHFEGESEAVKNGAIMLTNMDRIEVECLPRAIPEFLTVDLTVLETIDDSVHVYDLTAPDDVTIVVDPDEVVVSLSLPRVLVEDEEEELLDEELEEGMEPEVIGREGEEEEE